MSVLGIFPPEKCGLNRAECIVDAGATHEPPFILHGFRHARTGLVEEPLADEIPAPGRLDQLSQSATLADVS
jgi:hypothetical protein